MLPSDSKSLADEVTQLAAWSESVTFVLTFELTVPIVVPNCCLQQVCTGLSLDETPTTYHTCLNGEELFEKSTYFNNRTGS